MNDVQSLFPESGRYKIGVRAAKALLASSKGNRADSDARTTVVASALREGLWVYNGEPIIIDADWSLRDGHTRCHAVVETGKPIDTYVIVGVPTIQRGVDIQQTMDSGTNRTFSQMLDMEGVKSTRSVATTTKAVYTSPLGPNPVYIATAPKVNNVILLKFFRDHRDLIEAIARLAERIARDSYVPQAAVAAMLWQAAHARGFTLVEEFAEAVLSVGNGAQMERLRRELRTLGDGSAKGVRNGTYTLLRVAWDQWRRGLKRLSLPGEDDPMPSL